MYVFIRKALLCPVHHLLTYLPLLKGCVIFYLLVTTAYLSAARLRVKPLEFKINKNKEKGKKIMSITFQDLPNEIITKVLSYLELRDLFSFGFLSTATRAISRDKILWRKLTIRNKTLKTEFLKFMLRNGCKFLELIHVQLKGSIHLKKGQDCKNYLWRNVE
jgi:hypothetical protein